MKHGTALLLALLASAPALLCQKLPDVTRNACGPDNVEFSVHRGDKSVDLQDPAAGQALVYVLEEYVHQQPCLGLCNIETRWGVDGRWVGATAAGTAFSFPLAPGLHHLCINVQSRRGPVGYKLRVQQLQVEPGKTYVLLARLTQFWDGFPLLELNQLDPDQASLALSESRLASSQPK